MGKRTAYTAFVIAVAVAAGGYAFLAVSARVPKSLPREISPAEFLSEVAQGHVASIRVSEQTEIVGESSTLGRFRATMRVDRTVAKDLRARGVKVEFERFSAVP